MVSTKEQKVFELSSGEFMCREPQEVPQGVPCLPILG